MRKLPTRLTLAASTLAIWSCTASGGSNPTSTASAAAGETALATWTPPSLGGERASATVSATAAPSSSASSEAAQPELPPPPCPPEMVLVGKTCVDAYEDELQLIGNDGSLSLHPYYQRPIAGETYQAASLKGEFPQGYISRVESEQACKKADKRLCTKNEWQRACRGKGYLTYPYANNAKRDVCNSGKIHLLSQMFKNPPGGWKYEEHFNSPELNHTPGFLARGGEYAGCTTELGVHDMVGNLHEWVSDTVTQSTLDRMDEEHVERRKQPWREGNGIFMGGFFSTTSELGPGCFYITVAHEPNYHDYSTGFRCCKAADLPKKPETKSPPKPPGKVRPANGP